MRPLALLVLVLAASAHASSPVTVSSVRVADQEALAGGRPPMIDLALDAVPVNFAVSAAGAVRGLTVASHELTVLHEGRVVHTARHAGRRSTLPTAALPPAVALTLVITTTTTTATANHTASATVAVRTSLPSAAWDASSQWIGTHFAMLRRTFSLPAGTATSGLQLHIAGLGFFAVWVNGKRIDTSPLSGYWTTWNERVIYNSFQLPAGALSSTAPNAIGVMLGGGWRNTTSFPPHFATSASCDPLFRLLRLAVTDASGKVVLGSDTQWQGTAQGPLRFSSVYDGSTYDARAEQPGWATASFKPPADWQPAVAAPCMNATTMSPLTFPDIEQQSIAPAVNITTVKGNNVHVLDFGHNKAGYCRLTATGPAGTTIVLRHAEALMHPPYGPVDGTIYTGNLRSAQATDTFILKGTGAPEVFEPMFTYHGFRYVQMEGYPGTPTPTSVQQIHFRTDAAVRSKFSSSSPVLNAIQYSALFSQGSNLMSVPTDCPQRDERLGWMGDAGLSADSITINYDYAAMQASFLRSMAEDQLGPDGSLPDTVPYARYGNRPADGSWSAAFPQNLFVRYSINQDTTLARQYFPQLLTYLNNIKSQIAKSGGKFKTWKASYGDWVPADANTKVPNDYCAAFNYVVNVDQAAQLAKAIGDTSNATALAQEASKLRAQFQSEYYEPLRKVWANGAQTAMALALEVGVLSAADKSTLAAALAKDIADHKNHITSGIIGAKSLFPALTDNGQKTAAVDLAEQTSYPSWGAMIYNQYEPATSNLWELWDSPNEGPGMDSRNHHMFSSISAWLIKSVGGLSETACGRTMRLDATGVLGVSRTSTSLATDCGLVAVDYVRTGGVQCGKTAAGAEHLDLSCGADGGVIQSIDFASWGKPAGTCGAFEAAPGCHLDLSADVAQSCIGQTRCRIAPPPSDVLDATAHGACAMHAGELLQFHVQVTCSQPSATHTHVEVPAGEQAVLRLPEGGRGVWEQGRPLWREGAAVGASIDPTRGIVAVARSQTDAGVVEVTIGSGKFAFVSK